MSKKDVKFLNLMHMEECQMINSLAERYFVDDVKGGYLDTDNVMNARSEEMEYVHNHQLYTKVPRAECFEQTGKAPIRTGWVDTNKGTEKDVKYRSRWVAKEYKKNPQAELFDATPPLEALRLLLSRGASAGRNDTNIMVIDIRRAYFYAPAQRLWIPEQRLRDPERRL